MAITSSFHFPSSSVSTAEKSLTANGTTIQSNTTAGMYQVVISERGGLLAGCDFEVALWEKVTTGSNQTRTVIGRLVGPNSGALWMSPTFILINGWDFTMKKITGSDVAFDWSVRRVSGIMSQAFAATASSVSTAEKSLTTNSTAAVNSYGFSPGFYQLFVEPHLVNASASFELTMLEKSMGSGVQRRVNLAFFSGSQTEMYVSPTFLLLNGWEFTLKKNSGSDANFAWSIRAVP